MSDTFAVELPDTVAINSLSEFHLAALAMGVEISGKGRLPKGKLARALLDAGHTIVDTDFLKASDAASSGGSSEYGKRKSELIAVREAAIADAHANYQAALAALKAEFGKEDKATAGPTHSTGAWTVTAKTPRLDRDGQPKRNAKGDRVQFGPERSVTVTNAEIRALAPEAGSRGRQSKANTLYAAVVKGGWLPVEMLSEEGWESVLLADWTIEGAVAEESVAS